MIKGVLFIKTKSLKWISPILHPLNAYAYLIDYINKVSFWKLQKYWSLPSSFSFYNSKFFGGACLISCFRWCRHILSLPCMSFCSLYTAINWNSFFFPVCHFSIFLRFHMMQFNTLIVFLCDYLSFETNHASYHLIINGIVAIKDSNTNHKKTRHTTCKWIKPFQLKQHSITWFRSRSKLASKMPATFTFWRLMSQSRPKEVFFPLKKKWDDHNKLMNRFDVQYQM